MTSIKDCGVCEADNEPHANLLYIWDAEVYLLLSQSIKYGDISFLC